MLYNAEVTSELKAYHNVFLFCLALFDPLIAMRPWGMFSLGPQKQIKNHLTNVRLVLNWNSVFQTAFQKLRPEKQLATVFHNHWPSSRGTAAGNKVCPLIFLDRRELIFFFLHSFPNEDK